MTELSLAAQAVLKAGGVDQGWPIHRKAIAAALEAVVAKTKQRQYGTCWICDANELLAIAAELRGTTTPTETNGQT